MLLQVANLSKTYGKHLALDKLSFSLHPGEIVGFLGANGAGKSTLMNIVAGYLAPSEGTIWLQEREFLDNPQRAKQLIGYLPENPPLYLEMTTKEYLLFIAQIRLAKSSPALQRGAVDEVMHKLQLQSMSHRLIAHLSKGYRQRVGIASTLLGNPPLLLWDEPTAGLDPQQLSEIHKILLDLKKDHTILLSSHMLHEIEELCDRIIVIDKGKLIAISTPSDLKKNLSASQVLTIELEQNLDVASIEELKVALPAGSQVVPLAHASLGTRLSIVFPAHFTGDGRKILWQYIKKSNWDLLHFEAKQASLQESFLQLTQPHIPASAVEPT
jgi:ABC-2 type transport system ATP-binding protein